MRPCDRPDPEPLFDLAQPWLLRQREVRDDQVGSVEAVFSLANGFLGWRGGLEESEPADFPGMLIAGFHETWPLVHAEQPNGLPERGQTLAHVPAPGFRVEADGQRLLATDAAAIEFERYLDLRAGVLTRRTVWRTGGGLTLELRTDRLVSLRDRQVAAARYQLRVREGDARLRLISSTVARQSGGEAGLDEREHPHQSLPPERVLRPVHRRTGAAEFLLCHNTLHTGQLLACALQHRVAGLPDAAAAPRTAVSADNGAVEWTADVQPGDEFTIAVFAGYATASAGSDPDRCCDDAYGAARAAADAGWDELAAAQRAILDTYWDAAEISLEPAPGTEAAVAEVRQGLRLGAFHTFQAAAMTGGLPVPGKGLTGCGYLGHTMWDVDLYLLAPLTYTAPALARPVIEFRLQTLDVARRRSKALGLPGASYPWRTIDGDEASTYYPAGAAQAHVNAAIGYAIARYADATGDREVLDAGGLDVLVETARSWAGLATYSPARGGYVIPGVTGPDEYSVMVDNDFYTNAMARWQLRRAAAEVRRLAEADPLATAKLRERTRLSDEEPGHWEEVAEHLVLPYAADGTPAQYDGFFDRPAWDFADTPPEDFPLEEHHHVLVIYRHRVLKQPSVELAMLLLPEDFTHRELARAFANNDPLTVGDSSLSLPMQAAAAFRAGEPGLGWRYLRHAALADAADVQGDGDQGCHLAAMGGSWLAVTAGIAGMTDDGITLGFDPMLPRELTRIGFQLAIRGTQLEVSLGHGEATYRLVRGASLILKHCGEEVKLTREHPVATVPSGDQ